MQNKLQELTDKLYAEGLAKGRKDGEDLLAKARVDADKIISDATTEAEAILADARKEALELKTKVEADLKLAARESISATRQDIENLLLGKISSGAIDEAMSDVDFIKAIITDVTGSFTADYDVDIELVLPEKLKEQTEDFVSRELSKIICTGVDATFSKKINGGFRIGQKGQDWFISFTDDTFKSLINEYLRPATRKILFGESDSTL